MTESATPRRSRKQFWALVATFFAPLVIAFALYYGADGWRPSGSTHHGDLIDPARPLPQVSLQTVAGTELAPDFLHGKWNLLYIGAGSCDARCREALIHMRQTRLALNDDMARVTRLFLVTSECCDRVYFEQEHAGLVIARANTPEGERLLQAFPNYGPPVSEAGRIYIVDPLGNLMMSYAADAPERGLLEDLKKLLKLSHIG